MKLSKRKGFSFGLTSGIITTLGLIVGLDTSTRSKFVVISGILIIAVADALSDAMGMHISEEAEFSHSHLEVWEATFATFFSKLIFASTFIVPFLLLPLYYAVIASIVWGLALIILFSLYLAKRQKLKSYEVVFEHLVITVLVIILTYYIGSFIAKLNYLG